LPECRHMKLYSDGIGQRGEDAVILLLKPYTLYYNHGWEGYIVIRCAACRAISTRRRTTAHITVVSSVLCTVYVVNKTVSCVLMNMILVTII
jgi:hypothetical protein